MDQLKQMQAMFDQLFTTGQHGPGLSGQKTLEKSVEKSVENSVKKSVKESVDFSLERINLELTNSQEGRNHDYQ